MSSFAILRVQKLKTNGSVRASMKHAFRAQNTPNADPQRLSENTHIGAQSVDEAMSNFEGRLPEKIRANGVRCIEVLITGSPEHMRGMDRTAQDAYFDDARSWLANEFGGDENIVYAGIHRDESTPHMYAYIVPMTSDGRLCAKDFIGGSKHRLSELQTDFAESVGKKHGLERGIAGSKAEHKSISTYYAELNKNLDSASTTITTEDLKQQDLKEGVLGKLGVSLYKETQKGVADRLTERLKPMVVQAQQAQSALKRAERLQKALDDTEPTMRQFRGLDANERRRVLEVVQDERAKIDQEREAEEAKRRAEREARTKARTQNRSNYRGR